MTRPVASMTGSGSGAVDDDLGRVEAEVRSVNHRFLKTSLRVWGSLPPVDRLVEDAVRRRVDRGHVTVLLRFRAGPGAAGAGLDEGAFRAIAARLGVLAESAGLRPPTVGDVLRFPGVIEEAGGPGEDALRDLARRALEAALDTFQAARTTEGGFLVQEMERLLVAIEDAVAAIAAEAARTPTALRDRLRARIGELLEGTGAALEPDALAREVALLADKSDVQEEIARLCAHVAHARQLLAEGGAVGRRLDFLVQEMHREANTIGSKASELSVTHTVVALKADVERLREQVQNLE